jgi:hypothetical protein
LGNQADAVTKANGTPAGAAAQTAASTTAQLASTTAVPQALQQLSSASAASTTGTPVGLGQGAWGLGLTTGNLTTILKQMFGFTPYFYLGLGQFSASIAQQLTFGTGTTAGSGGAWYPTPQFAGLGGLGGWAGSSPGSVSASVGQAGTIGRLSVPPTWAAATPQGLETTAPGLLGTHAASHVNPGTSGLLRGMPLAGTGIGRRAAGGFVHRYGFRYAVVPRPPSAG